MLIEENVFYFTIIEICGYDLTVIDLAFQTPTCDEELSVTLC